ncbi:hypothetical protein BGW39_003353, partial [Mortierella sp. 14UC]
MDCLLNCANDDECWKCGAIDTYGHQHRKHFLVIPAGPWEGQFICRPCRKIYYKEVYQEELPRHVRPVTVQ